MDRAFLEGLGLTVSDSDGVVEAELDLSHGLAINPLTRASINSVSFTVMGDRLLYVGPAEFIGAPPISLAFLAGGGRLEDLVLQTLTDHLFQVERRSTELSALGIDSQVNPATLQLLAQLERGPFKFSIGASRTGQFRVVRCLHHGVELTMNSPKVFELSEFRDRLALEDFLYSMFRDVVGGVEPPKRDGDENVPELDVSISVRSLFDAFGDATVPPRSSMEFFAELQIGDERLRFAAARVQGRTFRGMLAGPKGKIWAERFELDDFPGIRALVSELLGVPIEQIEVIE